MGRGTLLRWLIAPLETDPLPAPPLKDIVDPLMASIAPLTPLREVGATPKAARGHLIRPRWESAQLWSLSHTSALSQPHSHPLSDQCMLLQCPHSAQHLPQPPLALLLPPLLRLLPAPPHRPSPRRPPGLLLLPPQRPPRLHRTVMTMTTRVAA